MDAKAQTCRKHDGMNVSFTTTSKDRQFPVCLQERKIEELERDKKFLGLYFFLGIDTMRLLNYIGSDKDEIQRKLERVHSELENPTKVDINRSIKILEEYMETRKAFPWGKVGMN